MPISRRLLFKAAGLSAAIASTIAFRLDAWAQQIAKSDAEYQDHPNGIQRCEICLQFQPPNRCLLVQGGISPNGWCQFFAAKENAQ